MRPNVMTIAGFDPSGGAGILADIKTFEHHQVYGFAVNTANTFQNENEFLSMKVVDKEDISRQIEMQFEKSEIEFIKIGLFPNMSIFIEILDFIFKLNSKAKFIWDPVLKSTSEYVFHKNINPDDLDMILSNVYLITPNIPEAKILFGENFTFEQLRKQSEINYANILLKGGHSTDDYAIDTLFDSGKIIEYKDILYKDYSKHGTGCVLSAAITANLSLGYNLENACGEAKKYITKFILSNKSNLGYHFNNEDF